MPYSLNDFLLHPVFWTKTILHFIVPGGYGYHRKLKKLVELEYDQGHDKSPLRYKHNGVEGWKAIELKGITYRNYSDYEEYVTHQKLKFDEMLKIKGGFDNKTIVSFRLRFFSRFKQLHKLLPKSADILCLGARQGTEVDVLRDLGFSNAIGIDLNPGPGNTLVQQGDFMKIKRPDSSVDFIYTNCVDHSFDLESFFAEHRRVLKPSGYAIYDLALPHNSGAFEAVFWKNEKDIILPIHKTFGDLLRIESDTNWKWVMVRGA